MKSASEWRLWLARTAPSQTDLAEMLANRDERIRELDQLVKDLIPPRMTHELRAVFHAGGQVAMPTKKYPSAKAAEAAAVQFLINRGDSFPAIGGEISWKVVNNTHLTFTTSHVGFTLVTL